MHTRSRAGGRSLVAGWYDPGPLDHENHTSLRSARPMHHPFRNREPLSRCELDRPAFQVNYEAALDHVEELILLVVLMPVKLALHHAEPNDAVVHSAQRLVIPRVLAGIDECLNVNEFQGSIPRVQVDRVWRLTAHMASLMPSRADDKSRSGCASFGDAFEARLG